MAFNEMWEQFGVFKLCFGCVHDCKAHGSTLSIWCPKYEKDQNLLGQDLTVYGNKPGNRNRQLRRIITYLKELELE